MSREILKDRNFLIIGYIDTKPNGDKVLFDRNLLILGYYEAHSDLTKDRNFIIVGHGDILTSLLS